MNSVQKILNLTSEYASTCYHKDHALNQKGILYIHDEWGPFSHVKILCDLLLEIYRLKVQSSKPVLRIFSKMSHLVVTFKA